MPLIRLSPDHWTLLAPGCWALGPQDVSWHQRTPPAATSVLLQDTQECWLIDCGAGHRRQNLLNAAPAAPTHILLSHAHPDHSSLLQHWIHLPTWMSHHNHTSWNHEDYVRRHWDQYSLQGPLTSNIPRASIIQALPSLESESHPDEDRWDHAVKEAILSAGREFYGDPPPFAQTQSLEELPFEIVTIGNIEWQGWRLGDLWIFPSRGHAPDQVVTWWSAQNIWFLSDETSAAPVWTDSDQEATFRVQEKIYGSLFDEPILIGGHQSFAVKGLGECRQFLERIIGLGRSLKQACQGTQLSELLYEDLLTEPWMQPFLRGQFPQGLFFAKQFLHNWKLRNSDFR